MTYQSGHIDIVATALEPLHHGAGTNGNTQVFRTVETVNPETGELYPDPIISGNSIKHMIRAGSVRYALDVMGVADESLSKSVVDLLMSGGHLGAGAQSVDLKQARDVARLFPALSLCGYSAGNVMCKSKISVHIMHLVCAENSWRMMPDSCRSSKHIAMSMWDFRGEEFGTRHEASRDPRVMRMLTTGDRDALVSTTSAKKKKDVDGVVQPKDKSSSQMIYEFQTISAGSLWWGGIDFDDISDHERAALLTGLGHACRGRDDQDRYRFALGAKSSIGFGQVAASFSGSVRQIAAPTFGTATSLVPITERSEVGDYQQSLTSHADEIIALLKRIAT